MIDLQKIEDRFEKFWASETAESFDNWLAQKDRESAKRHLLKFFNRGGYFTPYSGVEGKKLYELPTQQVGSEGNFITPQQSEVFHNAA
jgi:hypothetical protein